MKDELERDFHQAKLKHAKFQSMRTFDVSQLLSTACLYILFLYIAYMPVSIILSSSGGFV